MTSSRCPGRSSSESRTASLPLLRFAVAVVLVLVASAPQTAAGSPGDAQRPVFYPPNNAEVGRALYKPGTFVVSLGDQESRLDRMRWSRWNSREARGRGRERSCSTDQYGERTCDVRRVRIRLMRVRAVQCGDGPAEFRFTRIVWAERRVAADEFC